MVGAAGGPPRPCDARAARSQGLRQLLYRRTDGGARRTRETAFPNRSRRTPGAERVTERPQEHVRRPGPPVEARMSPSMIALSQRILAQFMPPAHAEALLGDLLEECRLRAESPASATRWYWTQL